MARYRKILVAYDGSDSARNALAQACRLAREDKSWIKVVAVVPAYAGDLELIGVRNIKETIEGPGQQLLAEAQALADREHVHILTDLEQGEPYEQIVHVAEDENCELIVVGRRGLSHLERELMGGVTARVIGHTRKDVLVIPAEVRLGWEHLLLATDGSAYSQAAEERAIRIASERGARLTAVSVAYTNDEFYAMAPATVAELVERAQGILARVAEHAAAAGIARVETVVKEGEPHQAIREVVEQTGADLIVMGSHGRKGLTRLLMGSVTERVIGLCPCPILISHL